MPLLTRADALGRFAAAAQTRDRADCEIEVFRAFLRSRDEAVNAKFVTRIHGFLVDPTPAIVAALPHPAHSCASTPPRPWPTNSPPRLRALPIIFAPDLSMFPF